MTWKVLVTFHCLIESLFLKVWFVEWFCVSFIRTCGNAMPWAWTFFKQNFRKSGFPLKFGSFVYMCRTTLTPYAISCSIAWISLTVRWSISKERLLIEEERDEFVFNWCLSMCVLMISSLHFFSTKCANRSVSSAVGLWFANFFSVILANCGSSALTSASFICAICISGALLKYASRVICSTLSAKVLICSPEARVMISNKNFYCDCDCLPILFFQIFFMSSGRCEYHCCAGLIRDVCIMAIRFRIQVSWYGESVCSGPAGITMFGKIAFRKASVV